MTEAVFAPIMHHERADQHREQDRRDHHLLLPRQRQRANEGAQSFAQGIALLPLAHSCRAF